METGYVTLAPENPARGYFDQFPDELSLPPRVPYRLAKSYLVGKLVV
jgi:hypothetical protein